LELSDERRCITVFAEADDFSIAHLEHVRPVEVDGSAGSPDANGVLAQDDDPVALLDELQ
jgi:hypothetical protein